MLQDVREMRKNQEAAQKKGGSRSRTRTYDKAVNSRLLYQLSYPGSAGRPYSEPGRGWEPLDFGRLHRLHLRRGICYALPRVRVWRNGRRDGLKHRWGQLHVSSSLTTRTSFFPSQLEFCPCWTGSC